MLLGALLCCVFAWQVKVIHRQVKNSQKFIFRIFLHPEAEFYVFHLLFLEIAGIDAEENCLFSEKERKVFISDLSDFCFL